MKFDLFEFGKEMHSIRKNLSLSIEEASFLADISERTISRIENGKNKISKSTLDKLSCAYKRDLFSIYNKYQYNPKLKLNNLIIDTERKLSVEDSLGIKTNINELEKLPLDLFTAYEELYIKYYIKLLESTYIDIQDNDRQEAISTLLNFIKSQFYGFEMKNHKNFNYSPIEIRVLMNLSSMDYNLYKDETSFEILSHLLSLSNVDNFIYPKLILNLSTIYHNKKSYYKSLELVEYGINYCINNENKEILSKMFFRKFSSELNLGMNNYKDSLNKAILLAEINNNEYLKKIFITSARKIYNVQATINYT